MLYNWQEVFHERVKTYKTWKDDEATLHKKREAKSRLELAHKMDKISAATHEISEVSIRYRLLYFILFNTFMLPIIRSVKIQIFIFILYSEDGTPQRLFYQAALPGLTASIHSTKTRKL